MFASTSSYGRQNSSSVSRPVVLHVIYSWTGVYADGLEWANRMPRSSL